MDDDKIKCDRCDTKEAVFYKNRWSFVLCKKCRNGEYREVKYSYKKVEGNR